MNQDRLHVNPARAGMIRPSTGRPGTCVRKPRASRGVVVEREAVRTRQCAPKSWRPHNPAARSAPSSRRSCWGSRPDLLRCGIPPPNVLETGWSAISPISAPGKGLVYLATAPGLLHQEGRGLCDWGDRTRHRSWHEAIDMAPRSRPTRRNPTPAPRHPGTPPSSSAWHLKD